MNAPTHAYIAALKGTLRYVRAYRDAVFVVKLGGEVMADPAAMNHTAAQVALLHSLGIRVVVIHGGGPQSSALSRRLGHEPCLIAGRRVTDDAALEVATYVVGGRLNVEAVSALRRHGIRAVGLSGIDADLVTAHRRGPIRVRLDDGVEDTVDFGHVGSIDAVDPRVLDQLLDARIVPVVSSLAGDAEGTVYNVNADTLAEELAVALHARKLVFLTAAPGLLRSASDPSSLVTFADADDLATLLRSGAISGGMRPKVESCMRAAARGVERTHIVDGRAPDALLLEVFTGEGSGTMIVHRKEEQAHGAPA